MFFLDYLTLKMETLIYVKTLGTTYPTERRDVPDGVGFNLLRNLNSKEMCGKTQ